MSVFLLISPVLFFLFLFFFFFNDTATTEIYTLSLHDALPIFEAEAVVLNRGAEHFEVPPDLDTHSRDRKSTRLNSSHDQISYAVFCLKKKKKQNEAECRRQSRTLGRRLLLL